MEENKEVKKKKVTMDSILVEEIGDFGMYQVRSVLLLSVAVTFIGWSGTEYLFTTGRIPSRCLIHECESRGTDSPFTPEWLVNAVPSSASGFDNCQRYANRTVIVEDPEDTCPAQLFDQQTVVDCDEYVYENTNTIVYDYDLACDEWRRSLIGSLRIVGLLLAMTVVGVISDRWGRRAALAITAINTAWIGVLRIFADTYLGFLLSQMFESFLGGGGYSCTYIIMTEIVGPKHRTIAGALINSIYAVSASLLGLIPWAVPDWRRLTLIVYVPQFLAVTFFWTMPESVRWYLNKGRYDEAEKVLKNIARINGKHLSDQGFIALKENMEEEKRKEALEKVKQATEPWLVILVFQHKPILLRCVVLPFWWITMTLIYYGMTVNSVNIAGNAYVNFIAVSLVEIPGIWLAYFMMEILGRKLTSISAFFVCAACQFAYIFMPDNLFALSLVLYLVGKTASSLLALTVYVYTTELYPTMYRHRLLAFSSMVGRIGALIAPLTPAFGDQLPFILFGSTALAAGLLGLLLPETRGARLPDTMREACDTARLRT